MRRFILAFVMAFIVVPIAFGAAQKVQPTIKSKKPVNPNVPLMPYDPPIEITYDTATRVLQITGDNDWFDHAYLFDEFGNWFHDSDWLPYTYTIPSDHSGIWIIRIYGVDSDDWDISAKIYVGQ